MIAQFNNINSGNFNLNGIPYKKVFIAKPLGVDSIHVVCIYDSKLELLPPTQINDIQVNGSTYGSTSSLINILKDILFSKTVIVDSVFTDSNIVRVSGNFKVGGSVNNFYPVVFKGTNYTNAKIKIYRNSIHSDASGRGSLSLVINNIVMSNYGHHGFQADVFNETAGQQLAKWLCNVYRTGEIVVYLRGDTTYWYELEDTNLVTANTNGAHAYFGSNQIAYVTPDSASEPNVTSIIYKYQLPIDSTIFISDLHANKIGINLLNGVQPSYQIDVNGTIRCTSLIQTSDKKFKKNIEIIDGEWALSIFNKLKFSFYDSTLSNKKEAGLIAQEVEKIIPEAVMTDIEGNKALDYRFIEMIKSAAIQYFINIKL